MKNDRHGVVVIGSAHVDLIAVAERIPDSGESLPGSLFKMTPGGKAANQSAQCALLSMPTWLVARTGDDRFGDFLVQALGAKGVDLTFCTRDDTEQTGASPIHVGQGGEYASIIVPGAAGRLANQDLENASPAFQGASVAIIQLELSMALATRAAAIARSKECLVVLNASPISPALSALSDALLSNVDYLVVNRRELMAITSSKCKNAQAVGAAASSLREATEMLAVVVTLGPDGAMAITRNETFHMPAAPVNAIDTVGAGDAFLGTLVTAIVRGEDLESALRFAVAAGALATTRHGAFDALPAASDLAAFLSTVADNHHASTNPDTSY